MPISARKPQPAREAGPPSASAVSSTRPAPAGAKVSAPARTLRRIGVVALAMAARAAIRPAPPALTIAGMPANTRAKRSVRR